MFRPIGVTSTELSHRIHKILKKTDNNEFLIIIQNFMQQNSYESHENICQSECFSNKLITFIVSKETLQNLTIHWDKWEMGIH